MTLCEEIINGALGYCVTWEEKYIWGYQFISQYHASYWQKDELRSYKQSLVSRSKKSLGVARFKGNTK